MPHMQELTALPASFAAGTTVAYTRTLADYPRSAGWGLTLILHGKGRLIVTATASGEAHLVTLTAAMTGALPAGGYTWTERVSRASEVYDVDSGSVVITPDVVSAGEGDLRDPDEELLEIVELKLKGRLSTDAGDAYQIAGRSVNKIPARELITIRNQLRIIVARKRGTGGIGRRHLAEFTR